jgi:hypothetical protein
MGSHPLYMLFQILLLMCTLMLVHYWEARSFSDGKPKNSVGCLIGGSTGFVSGIVDRICICLCGCSPAEMLVSFLPL